MRDKLINKKFVIIVIALVFLLTMGFSYAWWRLSFVQDKANTAVSKCFKLELANQANEINLTNMYPITDEEGRKLTPYTFTLKNTCSVSAKYSLNMEMLEGTTLNSNYLAVLVNNKDIKLLSSYNTATTVIAGSTESRILDTGVLQANSSKDYSISLWMDKSVTLSDDAQNKVFKSKVVVDAVATETALDKIIASVDTTGKCPTINSDETVNTDGFKSEGGYLCSASDTYGTSYYYRGNVTNNYVKFGSWKSALVYGYYSDTSSSRKEYDSLEACQRASSYNVNCTVIREMGAPIYWRIVRINGDGSVRLIYDGIKAYTNGEEGDRAIGTNTFNSKSDDNMYMGYMYGERDGVLEDESQYSTLSLSDTNSYYISKEYTFNESTKEFTLKDPIAIQVSDMTTNYIGYYFTLSSSPSSSYETIYKIFSVSADTENEKHNIGYGKVYYGSTSVEKAQQNINDSNAKWSLDRWYRSNFIATIENAYLVDDIFCNDRKVLSGSGYGRNKAYYHGYSTSKARLTCPQQNDAFTVDDTVNGNGALIYPIGLITADEVILAGATSYYGSNMYIYEPHATWTMSPEMFYNGMAYVYDINRSRLVRSFVGNPLYIRPVINVKPEALEFGDGTMENPYRLSEN